MKARDLAILTSKNLTEYFKKSERDSTRENPVYSPMTTQIMTTQAMTTQAMTTQAQQTMPHPLPLPLADRYQSIRANTLKLCQYLEPEDFVVQSMPDVSPTKWHLAHTSWFFEEFILKSYAPGYVSFNENYHYLFNSYYNSVGRMHSRVQRGQLTRPLVKDIVQYRQHVDQAMQDLLSQLPGDGTPESASPTENTIQQLLILGMNHEQQHQELLLTDIKHVFSCNPMKPIVSPHLNTPRHNHSAEHRFIARPAGRMEIGAADEAFFFDNETPRHAVLVPDHLIGSRLITNGEFREFLRSGGYQDASLWLSDGWACINERGWNRPLYWSEELETEFTLGGQRELNIHAPVAHVSYYEADAFARWADARLPTEAEWETFACEQSNSGNFQENMIWQPEAAHGSQNQLFGDVWEWTSSAYQAYPGFKSLPGSVGEYNGKFMCNQMVVRGGSCVTASDHIRASYRSFFYPDARWQFLGFRLAKNAEST